jgi:hypothetical protein
LSGEGKGEKTKKIITWRGRQEIELVTELEILLDPEKTPAALRIEKQRRGLQRFPQEKHNKKEKQNADGGTAVEH